MERHLRDEFAALRNEYHVGLCTTVDIAHERWIPHTVPECSMQSRTAIHATYVCIPSVLPMYYAVRSRKGNLNLMP